MSELLVRAGNARAAKLEAEVDLLGEAVATEGANRRLRHGVALVALALMAAQVAAANGIFAWYGVSGGWDVPPPPSRPGWRPP